MKPLDCPPDLEHLRKHVRGQLSREQRVATNLWLMQHGDENAPDVLRYLIREWEDEQADARLPRDIQTTASLFARLLRDGKAAWDRVVEPASGGEMPTLELAGPTGAAQSDSSLRLERRLKTSIPKLALRPTISADAHRAVILATNDKGHAYCLLDAKSPSPGRGRRA